GHVRAVHRARRLLAAVHAVRTFLHHERLAAARRARQAALVALRARAPVFRPDVAAAGRADRLPGPRARGTRHVPEDLLAVAVAALDGDVGVADRARGPDAALALAGLAVEVDPTLPAALLASHLSPRALAARD